MTQPVYADRSPTRLPRQRTVHTKPVAKMQLLAIPRLATWTRRQEAQRQQCEAQGAARRVVEIAGVVAELRAKMAEYGISVLDLSLSKEN
jgi:hypothetical protein